MRKPSEILKAWPKERRLQRCLTDGEGNWCSLGVLGLELGWWNEGDYTHEVDSKCDLIAEQESGYNRDISIPLSRCFGLPQLRGIKIAKINDTQGFDAVIKRLEEAGA